MSGPVVIVGAGPAGTRAAAVLVQAGLKPVVIDEAPASGGQIYRRQPENFGRAPRELYGFEAAKARRLHAAFDELRDRVDYRPRTLVFDATPDRLWTIDDQGRVEAIAWRMVMLATGAMDRVIPLPGWTLPGVFTLGGAQIALKYQACSIGRRVAFLGTGPLLYLVPYQYMKAGVEVAAVLDTSPARDRVRALPELMAGPRSLGCGILYTATLAARRVPLLTGVRPVRFEGAERVTALVVAHRSGERRFVCDAVGFGFWLKPETQLHDLLDVPFRFDESHQQWLPEVDEAGRTPLARVYAAGDGVRVRGADAAELAGERAALAMLEDLGRPSDRARIAALDRALARLARFRRGLARAFPFPSEFEAEVRDDTVVCRCERVTAGEIRATVHDLVAHDVNRAKAFSRVGMGRCQGRVCGLAAARIIAVARNVLLAEAGRLRGQAPVKPVPVAVTAAASAPHELAS